MALAVHTTLDQTRKHHARNLAGGIPIPRELVLPDASELPIEAGIPPETRMLAFVMIYMLAVSLGVGALLIRLW